MPDTTTCKTCNRLIFVEDAGSDGNCSEHTQDPHKPSEEEWEDIGRPE